MAEKQVKSWITVNGKHIPIFEGESKEDAVKRATNKKIAKEGVKVAKSFADKYSNQDKKAITDKQRKAAEQFLKNVVWRNAIDGEQSAEISADNWKHAGISNDKMVSILNKHDPKHEYRIEKDTEQRKMMGQNITINHYYLCRDKV